MEEILKFRQKILILIKFDGKYAHIAKDCWIATISIIVTLCYSCFLENLNFFNIFFQVLILKREYLLYTPHHIYTLPLSLSFYFTNNICLDNNNTINTPVHSNDIIFFFFIFNHPAFAKFFFLRIQHNNTIVFSRYNSC